MRGFIDAYGFGPDGRGVESCNPQPFAQFAYAHHGPRLSIDRFAPHAIHRCRQLTIRPVPTQFAHHLHGAEMTVIGISATPNLGDANLTMAATIPMDNQDDLIRLVIVVQHALLNQNPCESLFGSCVGAERVPGSR